LSLYKQDSILKFAVRYADNALHALEVIEKFVMIGCGLTSDVSFIGILLVKTWT